MWKDIIQELLVLGMTQVQIGDAVGLSQPAISDLLNGKSKCPRGDAAVALLALRKERAEKQAAA